MAQSEIERPSNAPQPNDLDALFEHDHAMDDIFAEIRENSNNASNHTREPKDASYGRTRPSDMDEDDEKIKITKKRAPVPKLDEARLVSDAGIPKLQRISKIKLKFKGRGHEFSDVAQLLRTYQLWLDDMYPRAKFSDGLAMIEKLGHSKRMQVRRKAWIDAGKPTRPAEEVDADCDNCLPATVQSPFDHSSTHEIDDTDTVPLSRSSQGPGTGQNAHSNENRQLLGRQPSETVHDHPDELGDDDLDALLAEETVELRDANETAAQLSERSRRVAAEPFFDDDDEDALKEMEGLDYW